MPKEDDIKRAHEIGRKGKWLYVWRICPDCGVGRWVVKCQMKNRPTGLCIHCSGKRNQKKIREKRNGMLGENHPQWKGGISKTMGYIKVLLRPNDPYFPMADSRGYVFEHRLVMAKKLGRCLHSWEIVHHKGRVRDNNDPSNLELMSDSKHRDITILQTRMKTLEKQVASLAIENTTLKNLIIGVT